MAQLRTASEPTNSYQGWAKDTRRHHRPAAGNCSKQTLRPSRHDGLVTLKSPLSLRVERVEFAGRLASVGYSDDEIGTSLGALHKRMTLGCAKIARAN